MNQNKLRAISHEFNIFVTEMAFLQKIEYTL